MSIPKYKAFFFFLWKFFSFFLVFWVRTWSKDCLWISLWLAVNNVFKIFIPYGKKATYQMLKDEILLKKYQKWPVLFQFLLGTHFQILSCSGLICYQLHSIILKNNLHIWLVRSQDGLLLCPVCLKVAQPTFLFYFPEKPAAVFIFMLWFPLQDFWPPRSQQFNIVANRLLWILWICC